jgi:hypothetical protein
VPDGEIADKFMPTALENLVTLLDLEELEVVIRELG